MTKLYMKVYRDESSVLEHGLILIFLTPYMAWFIHGVSKELFEKELKHFLFIILIAFFCMILGTFIWKYLFPKKERRDIVNMIREVAIWPALIYLLIFFAYWFF